MSNDLSSEGTTRRELLTGSLAVLAGMSLGGVASAADEGGLYHITNGRLKQGVCLWSCGMDLETCCKAAVQIGIGGIDLVDVKDWPTLKKYGLVCPIANSHSIGKGLNRTENHDECLAAVRKGIDDCAAAGFPSVITFSGNRAGMDDETGLKNCTTALKKIVGYAEEKKVTICMELLNSKHDHGDYMCDHSEWGCRLVDAVGSERFRLLYDIYHMQLDEGDVINTIRKYGADHFGHYHTAGAPGRQDLDADQELNYPAIMRAIIATGYKGFVSHEFTPKGADKAKALAEAARVCDQ